MNRYISIFVVLIFHSIQIGAQSWINSNKISSTQSFIQISSVINNGGEIFSYGYFEGTLSSAEGKLISSFGGRDYYLIKFLQDGKVDWMKNFGSNLTDFTSGGIAIDNDQNIYISGGFQGNIKYSPADSMQSTGEFDLFIMKLDEFGNNIWARNAGSGESSQAPTSMRIDNDGNLILAGIFIDSISIYEDTILYSESSMFDFFYSKFEPINGDLQWVKHARALNNGFGRVEDIHSNAFSNLYTGRFQDSIIFTDDTIVSYSINKSDVFLINSDIEGNISWIREISGEDIEYSYSVLRDDEDNIYISGFYNSDTLFVDASNSETITIAGNNGNYDIFIAKYLSSGILDWIRTVGGKYDEKTFHMEFFDNKIYLSGFFSDTLTWGGIQLTSKGPNDIDMFTGAFDKDGNFRDANKYFGRNNSNDQARGFFKSGENLYIVMRSNSDLLVLGDSIYTSDGISYNMYIGVIGCLPISIDNIIANDVNTCYGDSTGSLQILVTGGFGSPFQYSIDNGLNYQSDVSYFSNLPAGDYPVVVIDQKNCTGVGPVVTVGQPDSLRIELISSSDITNEADGSIVVAATGGTTPYTFTLLPDNLIQGFGTYTFQPGDSGRYVVQVNDAKNCGPVETDSIDIMDFYGVGFEDISELEVRMFPNPASRMITLEMPLEEAEVTLEIMSLTGQVLMSRQVYPSGGVLREDIDVSDLSRGMYMVRVNGKTLRSGIVVN